MYMKKITILTGTFLLMPLLTFAQFGEVDTFFGKLSTFISEVLVPLVFAIALLIFIWGMFKFFILGGHSEDEREKGKQLILWSIIGFVMMVSIWGVVNAISGDLFDDNAAPDTPKGPGVNPSSGPGSHSGPSHSGAR